MVGRVPLMPLFLARNATPTIPHMFSKRKDTGFPFGCADAAALDGRSGSNIYEVNPWPWRFGRGKPRLGGLSIDQTAKRQDAVSDACSRDKTGSQDGSSPIQSKGWYISVYTKLYMVYLSIYCFQVLLSLHNILSAHMSRFFKFSLLAAGCTILSEEDVGKHDPTAKHCYEARNNSVGLGFVSSWYILGCHRHGDGTQAGHGMYRYELSIRESKSAHDFFTLDSR
jgi:hypothetical protein